MNTLLKPYYNLLTVLTIVVCLFSSCVENESLDINTDIDFLTEFGKYRKELTVYDKSGKNSAVLLVGSDDESVLNLWKEDNFTLIPLRVGQTGQEAIDEFIETKGIMNKNADKSSNKDDSEHIAAQISTMFLSKNLGENIENVILYSQDPYDEDLRGWRYDTHYSDYYGSAGANYGTVTCIFYGQNFWHRGYYGLQFINYQGNGWSTIVSEWKQIKRNEDHPYTRTPCYVMKARRKYKGSNNNSVLVEFQY